MQTTPHVEGRLWRSVNNLWTLVSVHCSDLQIRGSTEWYGIGDYVVQTYRIAEIYKYVSCALLLCYTNGPNFLCCNNKSHDLRCRVKIKLDSTCVFIALWSVHKFIKNILIYKVVNLFFFFLILVYFLNKIHMYTPLQRLLKPMNILIISKNQIPSVRIQ